MPHITLLSLAYTAVKVSSFCHILLVSFHVPLCPLSSPRHIRGLWVERSSEEYSSRHNIIVGCHRWYQFVYRDARSWTRTSSIGGVWGGRVCTGGTVGDGQRARAIWALPFLVIHEKARIRVPTVVYFSSFFGCFSLVGCRVTVLGSNQLYLSVCALLRPRTMM